MIVERRLQPWRILRNAGWPLAALVAYDVVVTVLYVGFHQAWVGIDHLPLALLGSALAIIVGLRNNSAYDRWWEARTLWGSVVNNSRSFSRGALLFLPREVAATLVRMQIAWVHALRLSLWRKKEWEQLAPLLPPKTMAHLRQVSNVPTALQGEMVQVLIAATAAATADAVRLAALDRTLSALSDAQGGLERIKNTPLPRQFAHFPQVFVLAYCLLLPIGLVHDLAIMTPVGSTVIGVAFYLLDQIGRDLEDPFAGTEHDISMTAITRTIEVDLRQLIGETDTPKPLEEVDGVLA